ncbi:sensor histidine kinase [Clostridium aminobutyricum]|uniref:histidine kinase n=1 Tax=Clostridium aminobutyricum TaxID=33953 RepID=A0A939D9S1_CLOAM|nr:sensor histidine kinase [Clostridium aminobutyricum]MBN7773822.1 sensor histidine kinase [Clostridium aminobutyricum]
MPDTIEKLCKEYTYLTDEEIETIKKVGVSLQIMANLEDADFFIDCLTTDETTAIVVAEAKPQNVPSSYKKSVVGLLAEPQNEPAVARTFKLGLPTKQMKAVTQEYANVIQTVEPIWHDNHVIGVLIEEKNADENSEMRDRIRFTEQSYAKLANVLTRLDKESSWLADCIDEAVILVDMNGYVSYRNKIARKLYQKLGYTVDILGQPYRCMALHGSNLEWFDQDANYSGIEVNTADLTLTVKQISLKSNNVDFAVMIQDITHIREKEKELILKSVAIKEMHHRVKNSLQTIASLLRLQGRRTKSSEAKKVLDESMNRILAIASTHKLLAKVGVDQVNIRDVLEHIKDNTIRYFLKPTTDVTVEIRGDGFQVDSEISTSVALVVSELLHNSLQYAFDDGKVGGKITIEIENDGRQSCISVTDNGKGFDINNVKEDSLGLSIVFSIVKDKLKGTINVRSNEEGTSIAFDFKNKITTIDNVT